MIWFILVLIGLYFLYKHLNVNNSTQENMENGKSTESKKGLECRLCNDKCVFPLTYVKKNNGIFSFYIVCINGFKGRMGRLEGIKFFSFNPSQVVTKKDSQDSILDYNNGIFNRLLRQSLVVPFFKKQDNMLQMTNTTTYERFITHVNKINNENYGKDDMLQVIMGDHNKFVKFTNKHLINCKGNGLFVNDVLKDDDTMPKYVGIENDDTSYKLYLVNNKENTIVPSTGNVTRDFNGNDGNQREVITIINKHKSNKAGLYDQVGINSEMMGSNKVLYIGVNNNNVLYLTKQKMFAI